MSGQSPIITLPNGKSGIELTDDVHQDEPSGWMVFLHEGIECEYEVFATELDARRCADIQAENAGRDWLMYPLYPTHGVSSS